MIKIIAVGKLKEKAMQSLIDEYRKRIKTFSKMEIIEVADEMAPQSLSTAQMEQVKDKEGERILAKVKDDDYVILLDLAGVMLNSETLAEKIAHLQTYGNSHITFIIGGSLGLSKAVIERSDFRWQLSDLTFPHQLVRVILCEQIYRSFTIMHHLPYHK